jgi:hypothetical protein
LLINYQRNIYVRTSSLAVSPLLHGEILQDGSGLPVVDPSGY